jgi:hypothetical protein
LICKIIEKGLNVYCAHTNLDFSDKGLNYFLAKKVGLCNIENLVNVKSENLYKLVVFAPEDSVDNVRQALCDAGAGWTGNYSSCTFLAKGIGTFKPMEGTNPYIGKKGLLEKVHEYRIETIVEKSKLGCVIDKMIEVHPYEEIAYDVYLLENMWKQTGIGKIGMLLKENTDFLGFIEDVKKNLNLSIARVVGIPDKVIKKVGVFSGAFDEKIISKISGRIDALITGDIKYHTAQALEREGICVIDAGHYSTEIIVKELLLDIIKSKFKEIELIKSNVERDVFKYI